ncbi:prepilin peptidase [Devosia sp.]|uniref:prepilin peptidase n=1 Tax=Devosia sp. TaxID=1871048 RepID=UPI002FCA1AD3
MLLGLTWLILIAAGVVVLGRIVMIDFQRQKISNDNVIQLLVVGLALRALDYSARLDAALVWQPMAMSAALFVVLIGFWLAGKMGAGDVKLLSVMPLAVGMSGIFPFVATFLLFAILTYLGLKYPTLVPQGQWRDHAERFAVSNRVPFGVPIGAAGIVALLGLLPTAAAALAQ